MEQHRHSLAPRYHMRCDPQVKRASKVVASSPAIKLSFISASHKEGGTMEFKSRGYCERLTYQCYYSGGLLLTTKVTSLTHPSNPIFLIAINSPYRMARSPFIDASTRWGLRHLNCNVNSWGTSRRNSYVATAEGRGFSAYVSGRYAV